MDYAGGGARIREGLLPRPTRFSMPEGPEVETVRRSLEPLVLGKCIGTVRVSRLALRTPVTSRDFRPLVGRRISEVGRHGKLLWLRAGDDVGFWVRLGMTGQLTVDSNGAPALNHTHVRMELTGGEAAELRFCDPRRFGEVVPFFDEATLAATRARMGPDGITLDDAGRKRVAAGLRRTQRSIKDALLDQTVIAGVGNIYASEACYIAKLSPWRRGISLKPVEALRLVAAAEETLLQAVAHRGTSFSDYVDADGVMGDNARFLQVFQREDEACLRCGVGEARPPRIRRVLQGARSTFFCPRCQRLPRGFEVGL